MKRMAILALAAAILLALAYAYGGRGSGATPLDGTTAYVMVVHGCMCSAPAFGLVEVAAAPPAGVRLLDAEVTSDSHVFTMALDTEQEMTNCLLEGVADGYTDGDFIHTPGGITDGQFYPGLAAFAAPFPARR